MSGGIIWRERRRLWCGLPWTFTVYTLTDDVLTVKTGVLNQRYDETRLYRIVDLTVTRNIIQRLFGLGTIRVDSFDQSTAGHVELRNIPNVFEAKRLVANAVEASRGAHRVTSRELMGGMDVDDDPGEWR